MNFIVYSQCINPNLVISFCIKKNIPHYLKIQMSEQTQFSQYKFLKSDTFDDEI